MAKEMPISISRISDADNFDAAGRETAEKVLESVGRVPALAKHLPYDRGDMNSVLTQLAFRLAHALEEDHIDTADRLLALAIELAAKASEWDARASYHPAHVLDVLKEAWLKADLSFNNRLRVNNPP